MRNANRLKVIRSGVLLLLATWVVFAAGCSEPTPRIDVVVNRQVDHNAIRSLAVLEFDWTPPGARRVRPQYYQRKGEAADTPANPTPPPQGEQSAPGPAGDAQHPQTSSLPAASSLSVHKPLERQFLLCSYAPHDDEDDEDDEDEEDEEDDENDEDDEEDEPEEEEEEDEEEEPEEEEWDVDDELPLYVLNAGETVADQVAQGLLAVGRYSIRERRELSRVLDEHDLSVTEIIRDQKYRQAGGLLGVDALVVGKVHTFSDEGMFNTTVSFSCRCVATASGDVIWSMSGELSDVWPGTSLLNSSREVIRLMVERLKQELDAADAPDAPG
ncbi:MAG: hypothetical protein JSV78_14315 [Phycisphaerales bacterium]|nr:MAG: hypothetical protein JSV78_14315 [Phycisphaerales bacterium]